MIHIDMQPLHIPSPSDDISMDDKQLAIAASDNNIDSILKATVEVDDAPSTALTFDIDLVADIEDAKDATFPGDAVAPTKRGRRG
ncbi:hypothetical protein TRAPUB_2331 [Trametes pubescens]|uniref:Uncharacterized protein n=1 Tax=Trametes pubescens TaxID=154538 RepID=A0A1M2VGS8_TRAPU|nr:hypothetical protein TRAPUB_2331 [Trametes pubescens]